MAEGSLVQSPPLPLTGCVVLDIPIIWKVCNMAKKQHVVVAKGRVGEQPTLIQ